VHFEHASDIWEDFPELVAGVLFADGITAHSDVEPVVAGFTTIAASRLASSTEGELPEIQAWRRAFSKMGLKPTQYRSASEALLRRFRREGSLPQIHPLVDVCNAVSLASAVPVAVFDVSEIAEHLEVRRAVGDETYLSFSGQVERPEPREVIFVDAAGQVHARRWTNRQSAASAVRAMTSAVLIVAEALHESAPMDVRRLTDEIADALDGTWSIAARRAILSRVAPRFEI
jgi:DNA/RNA-binding domain of Phe-tRNA-synthetase-like protein